MPAALLLASQILNLVATGVQLAPEMITAAGTVRDLLDSGKEPTPEQEASIRAALDASEADLQKA